MNIKTIKVLEKNGDHSYIYSVRLDEKGEKTNIREGPYISFRKENLVAELNYENDVLEGECREYYYDNVQIRELYQHKNGIINGDNLRFSKLGNKIEQVRFTNGKRNGASVFFEDNDKNEVKSITYYVDDEIIATSNDGKLYKKEEINNTGKLVYYVQVGPNYEITNIKEGTYMMYYYKNIIRSVIHYINGKREGEARAYHSSGNLQRKYNFVNNLVEGESIHYYDNKDLVKSFECNYVKGNLDGKCIHYDEKQEITEIAIYKEGVEISNEKANTKSDKIIVSPTEIKKDLMNDIKNKIIKRMESWVNIKDLTEAELMFILSIQ